MRQMPRVSNRCTNATVRRHYVAGKRCPLLNSSGWSSSLGLPSGGVLRPESGARAVPDRSWTVRRSLSRFLALAMEQGYDRGFARVYGIEDIGQLEELWQQLRSVPNCPDAGVRRQSHKQATTDRSPDARKFIGLTGRFGRCPTATVPRNPSRKFRRTKRRAFPLRRHHLPPMTVMLPFSSLPSCCDLVVRVGPGCTVDRHSLSSSPTDNGTSPVAHCHARRPPQSLPSFRLHRLCTHVQQGIFHT